MLRNNCNTYTLQDKFEVYIVTKAIEQINYVQEIQKERKQCTLICTKPIIFNDLIIFIKVRFVMDIQISQRLFNMQTYENFHPRKL